MSPVAELNHRLSGLAGIRASKRLDDSLRDGNTLAEFARNMAGVHDAARAMPFQFLIIAEAEHLDEIRRTSEQAWSGFAAASGSEPGPLYCSGTITPNIPNAPNERTTSLGSSS